MSEDKRLSFVTKSLQPFNGTTAATDTVAAAADDDDGGNNNDDVDSSCIPNNEAPYCNNDETAFASSSRYPSPIIFPNPVAPNIPYEEEASCRGADGEDGGDERIATASIARHIPTRRTCRVE